MRPVACLACVLILLMGMRARDSQAQITTSLIEYGLARTVMIGIMVRDAQGSLKEISVCSASFVTPRGMIITASHCVRADEDSTQYNVKKGQLYNPDGWMTVYFNVPNQVKPVLTLFAKLVADNRELDMALLRTERLVGSGERPLPADFSVPYLPIGDSETVRHGDPILYIGFPSVGGDTVTVGRGHVTGFTADAQGRKFEMKTDLGAPGFSGAPVINERGEQVAVHTSSRIEPDRVARSGRATLSNRLPSEWAVHLGQTPSGSPQPAPTPAPAGKTTALLQGRIVDASSGTGVAGVGIWVLTPGTSFQEATDASVVASALTDGNGFFQARPAVTRGFTYPIVVLASGYRKLTGFVEVPTRSPQGAPALTDVAAVGTIALSRQ